MHWDLGTSQSYGEYLHLDKLLNAQKPNSIEQDEMLFIIVHQVSELWMRLFLHELLHVFECVRRDNLDPSFKMLARISRLQEELLGAWSVLSTLTPFEYSSFRNTLGRSSGFQSLQYRLLEFRLGNKNRDVIAVHKRDPEGYERLERALQCAFHLRRSAAPAVAPRLRHSRGAHRTRFLRALHGHKAVTAAWLGVYHNAEKDWDLYEMAERLVDLDQKFQLWRFHHLKTVERVIGYKPGTGGTGGVSYLAKALELKFFPELWQVRTSMWGCRRLLGELDQRHDFLPVGAAEALQRRGCTKARQFDIAGQGTATVASSSERVPRAAMDREPESKPSSREARTAASGRWSKRRYGACPIGS